MTETTTPKDRVLARWPCAVVEQWQATWLVYDRPLIDTVQNLSLGRHPRIIGRGATLDQAWADAERSLNNNEVPTIMDPEDGLICAACGRGHHGLPCPHVK